MEGLSAEDRPQCNSELRKKNRRKREEKSDRMPENTSFRKGNVFQHLENIFI